MQLPTGILSVLLLASGAIYSVEAVPQKQKTKIVTRTRTQWKTVTQVTSFFTSITSTRPWIATLSSTTWRKQFLEGPVETITVTKTVSSCEANPNPFTKDPIPIVPSDKGEDPYSTCPPVATVTAMKKCDGSKPECPKSKQCVAGQALIGYGCNCLTAPPRTTTITTRCPDECCGGYFPPSYQLLAPGGKCPQGTVTDAPIITGISLVQPPKLAPISAIEEEDTEDQAGNEPEEDDGAGEEDQPAAGEPEEPEEPENE
ncbi:hypothetical protein TWF281_010067 [Arthrobotrys megalospora]